MATAAGLSGLVGATDALGAVFAIATVVVGGVDGTLATGATVATGPATGTGGRWKIMIAAVTPKAPNRTSIPMAIQGGAF